MARQTFIERVYARVKEHGLKIGEVQSAADVKGVNGTSRDLFKLVKKEEAPARRPLVEAYAFALEVDPWFFDEWRLLAIRDAIDPQPGYLDQALANLKAIEGGATNEEIAAMVEPAIAPAGVGAPIAPSAPVQRLAGHARKRREGAQSKSRQEPGARGGSAG